MAHLTVILGAGFSFNAGFPLASAINSRFNRDQIGKLLRMFSSEWMWKDGKDEATIHNGTLISDVRYYSFLLNEIVNSYNLDNGGFTDYEDFFHYVNTNSKNKDWFQKQKTVAKAKFLEENPSLNTNEGLEYLKFIESAHYSRIIEIINYLVADLLFLPISEESLEMFYSSFAKYIDTFDSVTIFTLNHDLLLERIFEYFGISYSRGFSEYKSTIYFEDEPLSVFNNDFSNAKVKIVKLHGSLDYYRFQDSGEYNYFTTKGYRSKHYARKINLETKETLQEINSDIVPKFITGKDKTEIIKNDLMYSTLFESFTKEIANTDKILISGYSFRDDHINQELSKRHELNIINQRRSTNYPFKGNILNITSFDELFER